MYVTRFSQCAPSGLPDDPIVIDNHMEKESFIEKLVALIERQEEVIERQEEKIRRQEEAISRQEEKELKRYCRDHHIIQVSLPQPQHRDWAVRHAASASASANKDEVEIVDEVIVVV